MRAVQHYYNVRKLYKYIFITYLFLFLILAGCGVLWFHFQVCTFSGSYLTKKNK
jgi:hypothetical protein